MRRPSRRVVAVVVAAVAVAAAATVVMQPGGGSEALPVGPIEQMPEGRTIIYGRGAPDGYVVGSRFSDGLLGAVEFETTKPVTITDVRPVGGGQALRYLGARVVPMPRGFFPYQGFDDFVGYPHPKPAAVKTLHRPMYRAMLHSRPAEGAVLHPRLVHGKLHNEPMILLGFEVVKDTYEIRKGVRIDYRVDAKSYSAFFALRFEYCPTYPVKGTDGHCTGVRPRVRKG